MILKSMLYIAGMGKTAVRAKSYSFTEPYYYRDNCIVVRADSDIASVTGLSQLKGKNVKITTQLGTGWVDLLDQIPDGVLVLTTKQLVKHLWQFQMGLQML